MVCIVCACMFIEQSGVFSYAVLLFRNATYAMQLVLMRSYLGSFFLYKDTNDLELLSEKSCTLTSNF